MKPFTKKLTAVGKDLVIISMSYVAALVALFFILIFLIILIQLIAYMANPSFSQKDICEIVLKNQDDLEMIVDDLRSYDMPRVYVNKENVTTYMSFDRLPDGRYILGHEDSVLSTSEELQRFMKKLGIRSIEFSLYDELQIVTFEVNDERTRGAYWVDPDMPTEKDYTSQHHNLTPAGDGWEFEDFGKRYYTEKICDNWYFYKVET